MKNKILIIEDNKLIAHAMKEALKKEDFMVVSAFDGTTGLEAFDSDTYDIVLLDLVLPDIQGKDIIQAIRKKSNTPIIVISIKDTELDKVINLELGADDYMTKPVSFVELTARINAIIRRAKNQKQELGECIKHKHLSVNFQSFEAKINDQVISLTAKEFSILELFLRNPNTLYSKEDVYSFVWNEKYLNNANVLNVHMRRLREKIELDPSKPEIIETVWGFGYRLKK